MNEVQQQPRGWFGLRVWSCLFASVAALHVVGSLIFIVFLSGPIREGGLVYVVARVWLLLYPLTERILGKDPDLAFLVAIPLSAMAYALLVATGLTLVLPRSRYAHECPACGYDLRGTPGSECPECGAASASTSGKP